MNHETISKYFQSELGQQCNSLFSTDDDRVFIRYNEALKHSQDNNLNIEMIMEWFEEWSGSDISPQIRNIIAFIEEKAETRGWENAECFAGDKFGEDLTREAIMIMGKCVKIVGAIRTEPCANCKEMEVKCACFRSKCTGCGNPVGNVTFTVCDTCWDKEFKQS